MSKLTDFCTRVDAFLRDHKIADRTLGEQALNNAGFVTRLRAGSRPRIDTIEAVEAWMAAYARRESGRASRKVA